MDVAPPPPQAEPQPSGSSAGGKSAASLLGGPARPPLPSGSPLGRGLTGLSGGVRDITHSTRGPALRKHLPRILPSALPAALCRGTVPVATHLAWEQTETQEGQSCDLRLCTPGAAARRCLAGGAQQSQERVPWGAPGWARLGRAGRAVTLGLAHSGKDPADQRVPSHPWWQLPH